MQILRAEGQLEEATAHFNKVTELFLKMQPSCQEEMKLLPVLFNFYSQHGLRTDEVRVRRRMHVLLD